MLIEAQIPFVLNNAIQPREGDASLPTREAIIASVMRTLTPAQAREILQFNEAKLVLTPVTSVERYRQELTTASQTMEGSRPAYISEFAQNQLTTQATLAQVEGNRIKKWRFAITEGAQIFDIPEWDNGQETTQQRIARFNSRFAQSQMSRLDYQSYIALMIQGLRNRKPVDCKYKDNSSEGDAQADECQYTLLNETDEQRRLVGYANWYSFRCVSLGGFNFYDLDVHARLRAAVMGDIIEI